MSNPDHSSERQDLDLSRDDQRRSPRYPVDWAARYRLDPGDSWRVCRVVDVSTHGVALELEGATLVEGIVGPIDLQIASVGGRPVGVALRTVIRHHRDLAGRVIVGVEFGLLRPELREAFERLLDLRADVRARPDDGCREC
jgi:hypothetical protein